MWAPGFWAPGFWSAGFWGSVVSVGTLGRPSTDVGLGEWLPSTGTDLYSMLDEETPNDADYIYVRSLSTCEVALSETSHPGSAIQVLRYRASSSSGNGLTVTLRQGGTTIATWSHALTGTDTLYSQTLTAPQIASITAGAGLSLQLTSTE